MIKSIKKLIKLFVPQSIIILKRNYFKEKLFKEWLINGSSFPTPHIVKQITIEEYQKLSGYNTLIETGTYMGEMVEAQKIRFKKIISIELGVDLYNKAQEQFKNDNNVFIMQGDSGEVLPQILKDLNEPAIFWLDGHYSEGITAKGAKDCPIFEELDAILNTKKFNHILLIDDARCFIGEGDYPTIENLTEYIKSKNEKYQVEVKYDIIRYII